MWEERNAGHTHRETKQKGKGHKYNMLVLLNGRQPEYATEVQPEPQHLLDVMDSEVLFQN